MNSQFLLLSCVVVKYKTVYINARVHMWYRISVSLHGHKASG